MNQVDFPLPDEQNTIITVVTTLGSASTEEVISTVQNTESGLSEDEIETCLQELEHNGYITQDNDKYKLTGEGNRKLRKHLLDQDDVDGSERPSNNSIETPENPSVELTGFHRDLLVTIGYADVQDLTPVTGLQIKDSLVEQYEKEVQHGRLYPNLNTLVQKGLIEKSKISRRTNGYELTQLGFEVLKEYDTYTDIW